MIDPTLGIAKLEHLAWLAATAESDMDQASLFAATMALFNSLKAVDDVGRLGLEQSLESARWSICAMLGYDTANGHSKQTHLAWALGWLAIMRRTLGAGERL